MKNKLVIAVVMFCAVFQSQASTVKQRSATSASTGYYAGTTTPATTSEAYYAGSTIVKDRAQPASTSEAYYAGPGTPAATSEAYYGGATVPSNTKAKPASTGYYAGTVK